MEARVNMDEVARRIDAVNERLQRKLDGTSFDRGGVLGSEARELSRQMRNHFRWQLVTMLAGFAGLLGVMAHGFHWL